MTLTLSQILALTAFSVFWFWMGWQSKDGW